MAESRYESWYGPRSMAADTKKTPRPDDDAQSLLAELEALLIAAQETEHAAGWNAALREVAVIVKRRDHDRQRKSAAAIAKRTVEGKKTGGLEPYGYEVGPDGETLREKSSEQKVIAAARKLHEAGHSLREIARRLEQRGMRPRNGETFHPTQIQRMLAPEATQRLGEDQAPRT